MKRVYSKLWNDCFYSMTLHEYESKSISELEDIYTDWLQEKALKCKVTEAKATSYDRLMSGGKHDITLKELANILHMVIVANKEGQLIAFDRIPKRSDWGGWYAQTLNCMYWGVPLPYAGYDKDWENSLTIPDGWEDV